MEIITTPDSRLREKSEKVSTIDKEVLDVIAEMRRLSLEWEKEHPSGVFRFVPAVSRSAAAPAGCQ